VNERKGEAVSIAWEWPTDQCITYKVSPLPGSLMSATSIAKQLLAIAKLLELTEDGLRWKTCIRGIYTEADGSLTFDLSVAPRLSSVQPPADNPGKTEASQS
jgi:hypothetical protein